MRSPKWEAAESRAETSLSSGSEADGTPERNAKEEVPTGPNLKSKVGMDEEEP